jgi:hypothetical protein
LHFKDKTQLLWCNGWDQNDWQVKITKADLDAAFPIPVVLK